MTFQFEDDSALEELLNQQLNRNKRQLSSSDASNRLSNRLKLIDQPIVKNPLVKDPYDDIVDNIESLPDSLNPNQNNNAQNSTSGGSKSLSSWLYPKQQATRQSSASNQNTTTKPAANFDDDSNDDNDIPDNEIDADSQNIKQKNQRLTKQIDNQNTPMTIPFTNRDSDNFGTTSIRTTNLNDEQNSKNSIYDKYINQETLQQMSKQALLRVILDEILPELKEKLNLGEINISLRKQLTDCQLELKNECLRRQSLQREQEERIRLAESSWIQLNKQLEYRLEFNQNELKETIARYDKIMVKFEEDRAKQVAFVTENYQNQLEELRQQNEAEIKRRQAIHEMELSSRFRVQGELKKLDSVFDCWQVTIESTIKQLETQFKSIESLLDKQTTTIRWNNEQLSDKNKETSESAEKIHQEVDKFNQLTKSIELLMSQISSNVNNLNDRDTILREANLSLQELRQKTAIFESKQAEISAREQILNQEKFELRLNLQKIDMDKARLVELKEAQDNNAKLINEREIKIDELEKELKKRQLVADYERIEMDQSREKLLLEQKSLKIKQQELNKWQLELGQERRLLRKQANKLDIETNRMSAIKISAQKELDQLHRLQKSLVCSICLDRLYDIQAKPLNGLGIETKTTQDHQYEQEYDAIHGITAKTKRYFSGKNSALDNLQYLKQKIERDKMDIAKENKFVKLLQSTN